MPVLLLAGDALGAVAQGLSLHYLPLFLIDALHVPPAHVPFFLMVSRLLAAAAAFGAHRAASIWGRVPALLTAGAADVLLLLALGCVPTVGPGLVVLKAGVVLGHVGACGVEPLGQSLMMDALPKVG